VHDMTVLLATAKRARTDPSTGLCDYDAVGADAAFERFEDLSCALQTVSLDAMGDRERCCFLINVYNICIQHGLIRLGTVSSDMCRGAFFDSCSYNIGGDIYSLSDIEHGLLRGNRRGPYKLLSQLGGGLASGIYGGKGADADDRRMRGIVRYERFWRSSSARATAGAAAAAAGFVAAAATGGEPVILQSRPVSVSGPNSTSTVLEVSAATSGTSSSQSGGDTGEFADYTESDGDSDGDGDSVAVAVAADVVVGRRSRTGADEPKISETGRASLSKKKRKAKSSSSSSSSSNAVFNGPVDNRVHFALNCGARSCPPVRYYTPETLDEDLDLAARAFCEDEDNVVLSEDGAKISLSRIFFWYWKDFTAPGLGRPFSTSGSDAGNIGRALLPFMSGDRRAALSKALVSGSLVHVSWLPYDWTVPDMGKAKSFASYKVSRADHLRGAEKCSIM